MSPVASESERVAVRVAVSPGLRVAFDASSVNAVEVVLDAAGMVTETAVDVLVASVESPA
jgi:hypothetical protein